MNSIPEFKGKLHLSGLFSFDMQKGTYYDFFKGRIIFPYWKNGKVVYMAARKTNFTPDDEYEGAKYKKLRTHKPDDDKAKYISKHIQNDTFIGEDSIRGEKEMVSKARVIEKLLDSIEKKTYDLVKASKKMYDTKLTSPASQDKYLDDILEYFKGQRQLKALPKTPISSPLVTVILFVRSPSPSDISFNALTVSLTGLRILFISRVRENSNTTTLIKVIIMLIA